MTAHAVTAVRGPCIARSRRLIGGDRIRSGYCNKGASAADNAAARGPRPAVLESPLDNFATRLGQTRVAVDCQDWPLLFAGTAWRLRDRASPTGRNPRSGLGCPPRGKGTSVYRRSERTSRQCATSRTSASLHRQAAAALLDRTAGPNARWSYGRRPSLAPPSVPQGLASSGRIGSTT